ncbi:hypothetical protein ACF0H5_020759 [Mactra antiquata]
MNRDRTDQNIPTTSRHFDVPDSQGVNPNCTRRKADDDDKSENTSDGNSVLQEAEDLLNEIDEYYANIPKSSSYVDKSEKENMLDKSESKIFYVTHVGNSGEVEPTKVLKNGKHGKHVTSKVKKIDDNSVVQNENTGNEKDTFEHEDTNVKENEPNNVINVKYQNMSIDRQKDVLPALFVDINQKQTECKHFIESENHHVPFLTNQIVKSREESVGNSKLINKNHSKLENEKLNTDILDLTEVLKEAKYIKSPSIENILDNPKDIVNEVRRPECVIISAPTTEIFTCGKDSVGVLPARLPGVVPRYKEIEYSFNSVTVIDSAPVNTGNKKENKKNGGIKRLLCGCFGRDRTDIEAILDAASKKNNADLRDSGVVNRLDHTVDDDNNDDVDDGIDHLYTFIDDNDGTDDNNVDDDDFVDTIFGDNEFDVHKNEQETLDDGFLHFEGNIEVKETRFRKLWKRIRSCCR